MIKINFSPVRAGEETTASITGATLTLNGTDYDLSLLNDGDTAENAGDLLKAERNGSDYDVTIRLTHGANAPQSARFPLNVHVTGDWTLEYDYDMA